MSGQADPEDIYPLTAVQQAWLLHSLRSGNADTGFQHNRATLQGDLDVDAYRRAWQMVIDRHPGLRTSLHWRDLDRAAQVVHRRVVLPFTFEDWRHHNVQARSDRLEQFLAADRQRGFNLETAPLMRVALIQAGDRHHELVWSLHHIMMDGWSAALVSREVFTAYSAFRAGAAPQLTAPGRFRDYVDWLRRQRAADAEAYWRNVFASGPGVTPLGKGASQGDPARRRSRAIDIPAAVTARLELESRRLRVTTGSTVLAAWALILSRWTGADDVIFGTTVSGRAPEIPNVDAIVGLMLNTLAVRMRLPKARGLGDWLREIQAERAAATPYQHTPLEQVIAWSGLPHNPRLFDSLVVFENYPAGLIDGDRVDGLRIDGIQGAITSAYPLNVIVLPGARYRLRFEYDEARFDPALGAWLERAWCAAFEAMADASEGTVAGALARLPAPDDRMVGAARQAGRSTHAGGLNPAVPTRVLASRALETQMERDVASIWSEELEVDLVDVDSNFFDLGGYSLLAVRVMERLERDVGVRLELKDLVFQTLRQVAAKCERLARESRTP